MTPIVSSISFFIGAALITALVLIPAATAIPRRLLENWQRELVENGASSEALVTPVTHDFSFTEKIAMVVCGGLMGSLAAVAYPSTNEALVWCGYLLGLILLLAINLKHELLPDVIVFPLVCAGLLHAAATGQADQHIYGGVVAYAIPFALTRFSRGRSIGDGDVKALGMAGAWFGLAALPVLFAVFATAIVGIAVVSALLRRKGSAASGIAHLAASLACLLGPRLFSPF